MSTWDEKIKHIVMAGIGAVVETVEKSKEAITSFVDSEQAKKLASKGEEAVQSVADATSSTYQKIVDKIGEAEFQERIKWERNKLMNLASQVSALTPAQYEVFSSMLEDLKAKARVKEERIRTGDAASEEAIGTDGVVDSPFDPQVDTSSYQAKDGDLHQYKDPLAKSTPTSPDDDMNARIVQTDNMNEHLKQSTPRDF